MPLSEYQRFAYRLLGPSLQRAAESNVHLKLSLQKAHVPIRPEVYLSQSYLNMILSFGCAFLGVVGIAAYAFLGSADVSPVVLAFLVPLPILLAVTTYLVTFVLPDMKASLRARDINAKLPYALNYIATMAAAGMTPERIFGSLATQPLYGEVANEAAWIHRDLKILGKDLVSALTHAIDRSPSVKFQDFLQGAITALTSGEDLKTYFMSKSEQFVQENRQEQKKFLDNLGVLAESYVTVVVTAPVLLLVLLTILLMIGGDPASTLVLGYLLVFVLVPLAQLGFGITIKAVTPEV